MDLLEAGVGPLVVVGGEEGAGAGDKGRCRVLLFTEQRVFLDLALPLQPAMR
jgi:hypothetical protein